MILLLLLLTVFAPPALAHPGRRRLVEAAVGLPDGGALATATGLLFYGQPSGGFTAVDQRTGTTLWQFPTNARIKASPMTFSVGGRQYVAVAAMGVDK